MKQLALLGATGSIGTQVLDIIRNNPNYQLKSIAFGSNVALGKKIIQEFSPEYVSVFSKQIKEELQMSFPDLPIGHGEEGLISAATYVSSDGFLINAIVGMRGLLPTIRAIEKNISVLLANKETLVVAGEIIMSLVKKHHVQLIPIDSEHSAIFQCLECGKKQEVSRLILTASGGAFRNKSREELEYVTIDDALRHPSWQMGPKITIDSATMVNKGLEIIEAHYLFDMAYQQIETVIHPESIIHSLVEYVDGSVIAQMSYPNMRLPIQYALTYPNRKANQCIQPFDFTKSQAMHFSSMNLKRYPLLALAYEVGIQGGIMPAVYNAANEAAVSLFLNKKISFLDIENIIIQTIKNTTNVINPTLDELLLVCKEVSEQILRNYEVKNG